MALTTSIYTVTSSATLTNVSSGTLTPKPTLTKTLAAGSGSSQVNCVASLELAVVSGTPYVLDLIGGGLTQPDGSSFNPNSVKELLLINRSDVATLTVGGGSNPWVSWLGGTAPTVTIPPGGHLHVTAPAAGFAVTSTTDKLQITSSTGTATVSAKVMGVQ